MDKNVQAAKEHLMNAGEDLARAKGFLDALLAKAEGLDATLTTLGRELTAAKNEEKSTIAAFIEDRVSEEDVETVRKKIADLERREKSARALLASLDKTAAEERLAEAQKAHAQVKQRMWGVISAYEKEKAVAASRGAFIRAFVAWRRSGVISGGAYLAAFAAGLCKDRIAATDAEEAAALESLCKEYKL
ncbi:hypothetical protein [Geoalkalibacter sp.]|uniref:hypothetical protein n=1 Tax=Geoalkalibacter sp. TaxID=3041440 RepID=UPI00272EBCF9|nr:hypothetical protein [Geoalkalibacter sp.]